MKAELTCAIVADLLPSYVEGLTSRETNEAIAAHVDSCPACARRLADMTAPAEVAPAEPAETVREVDYLKKIRRRNRRRVVLAVVCTILLALGAGAARIFLIGAPASAGAMAWEAQVLDGDTLHLQVTSAASANAYWGWETRLEGNVVTITCREGLVSRFHPIAYGVLEIPLDQGVEEVRLVDRVVWQDGVVIDRRTLGAWSLRTPYVGDAPALGAVAEALRIRELCGDYTTTLHTSDRPYGWTLDFLDYGYNQKSASLRNREMERLSVLMLALVDNLDEVSWTWKEEDGPVGQRMEQQRTVTLQEVNASLPELFAAANEVNGTDWTAPDSVKDCAESPAALQRLWTALKTSRIAESWVWTEDVEEDPPLIIPAPEDPEGAYHFVG